ncbi:hypothetical protein F5B20DRAFT_300279 [Whalleya microplaca]|nr:hypothetical protein F5B20DRAFT_300279 [Whalleya microplaca]
MDQPIGPQVRAQPKPKMNYACEACRAAKIRCQSGPKPGICRRCSEFKRECVFRTGPRTRRPKVPKPEAELRPPPPGPSKTFSIDFSVPSEPDADGTFDLLRAQHEQHMDGLIPSSEDFENFEEGVDRPPGGFSFNDLSIATPSSASTTSASMRPMSNLAIKPQFNLDSAGKLLESFRLMLPHCPCLLLPDDVDVRTMARRTPFVLLAILAITSCSTSLQGQSLYEFRKVLGLKFVMGGERSLELLQGLLIYCSWYPFHLRPKNKQLFQYLRMAADIVQDLELDHETDLDLAFHSPERIADKLQDLRAFLGCYYGTSTYSLGWTKPPIMKYTSWIARCADVLEQYSDLDQDHTLVWLVRLQSIVDGLYQLHRGSKKSDTERHQDLLRLGLESQLQDFQNRIPSRLSSIPSIPIASLTSEMYLMAGPLLRSSRPRPPRPNQSPNPEDALSAPALLRAAHSARALFDGVCALTDAQLVLFSGFDWARFILAIIAGIRLSFPLPTCPEWDYARGRSVLDLGAMLAGMAAKDEDDSNNGGDGGSDKGKRAGSEAGAGIKTKKIDVVTALRVVLRSIRARFEKKSAELDARVAAEEENRRARLCPMFDGSLEPYLPLWEGEQGAVASSYTGSYSGSSLGEVSHNTTSAAAAEPDLASSSGEPGDVGDKPMVYHDLWATMTMGWGTEVPEAQMTMTGFDNMEYADYVNP